ncbi:MAG: hypothetical protein AAB908_02735 [Patescibacteria group bacterium]
MKIKDLLFYAVLGVIAYTGSSLVSGMGAFEWTQRPFLLATLIIGPPFLVWMLGSPFCPRK